VLVIVALVTVRDYRRLDVLLLAFGFAAAVTVVIAGFMPALSPLAHFAITPADHPNIVLAVPREFETQALALRDGSMRMIELGEAQGLVTFPSFHTVVAVLLLLGFLHVPYLRWVGFVLNGLMLISIPVEGSHYLVDLIAGVGVAWLAWGLARVTAHSAAPAVRRRIAAQPPSGATSP
jgi:membrane-associated phospholipid phosphatase